MSVWSPELEDGNVVRGETQISASRVPIRRLRLEPEQCLPLPKALKAIRARRRNYVGSRFTLHQHLAEPARRARVQAIGESGATQDFHLQLDDSTR